MSTLLEQASLVLIPSGYKEDVVYSQIPTNGNGDLSFTRASNGTRVNSAGLVEVVAWNLVTNSNDFASGWALIQSSKSTGFTDPVGNSNAIKLNYTTVSSSHYMTQGITLGGSNAHSVYAKAGELSFLQIASAQTTDEYANFNLSTGVIGTYGSRASNVQIENVGNGWYRCSVVFTNGSIGIYCAIVQSASSDWFGVSAYAGANNTDGLYLYGGQVNTGALKPYFPTTDRLNVPRLTYQNGGGGCPSLLLEKQSTNLSLYSQDFSDGSWITLGSTKVSTDNLDPSGTNTALNVTWGTGGGKYFYRSLTGLTIGTTYTITFYAKSSNGSKFVIYAESLGYRSANFTTTSDFQRFELTYTATATSGTFGLEAASDNTAADLIVAFAQFEPSSYPTSYIPTTTASATRVADACFKTGISSLIGQTEGVIFWDINFVADGTEQTINISDGTNFIYLQKYIDNKIYTGVYNGSFVGSITSSVLTSGRKKIAFGYILNSLILYINGVSIGTDLTSTIPTCDRLSLTVSNTGSIETNNFILFPTKLTNAELASLTTI
jgi:hypothetical protein